MTPSHSFLLKKLKLLSILRNISNVLFLKCYDSLHILSASMWKILKHPEVYYKLDFFTHVLFPVFRFYLLTFFLNIFSLIMN